jgi:hypothetical protein
MQAKQAAAKYVSYTLLIMTKTNSPPHVESSGKMVVSLRRSSSFEIYPEESGEERGSLSFWGCNDVFLLLTVTSGTVMNRDCSEPAFSTGE